MNIRDGWVEFRGRWVHTLDDVARVAARHCAEKLETESVLLDVIPGETKQAHVMRYAKAMAAEIRREFGLPEPK